MAAAKILGKNWSFSQSVSSYFSCCYNTSKDKTKKSDTTDENQNKEAGKDALEDEDDSDEIVIINGPEDVDDIDTNLIVNSKSGKKGYGSVQSLKSNKSAESTGCKSKSGGTNKKGRDKQKKNKSGGGGNTNADGESVDSVGKCSSLTSNDTGVGTLSHELNESDDNGSTTANTLNSITATGGKSKKRSSYNYDDQDTSSDSDDEVLQRYQKSVRTSGSSHSLRGSARNLGKSSGGKSTSSQITDDPHESGKKDHKLSLVEKGGKESSAYSSGEESDNTSPYKTHHLQQPTHREPRLTPGATPTHEGGYQALHDDLNDNEDINRGASTSPSSSDQRKETTYDNQAFLTDDLHRKNMNTTHSAQSFPVSSKGSTRGENTSQYGADTTSVSVGETDKVDSSIVLIEREAPDGEDAGAPTGALNTKQSGSKEHLFDVSDLQDREPVLISKCGNLEVTFDYERDKGRMKVTIHQAKEIPTKDRGGSNHNQVRLLLLPSKKVKHKTKIKTGDNPVYEETFAFKVPEEDAEHMGLRFRLYGCERMRRERMIGESIVGFASINMDSPTTHMMTLEPRSNLSHGDSKMDVSSLSRSDSASSTQSMQHGGMPELLTGLSYNGTTGRLSVEVIKGSNFRNMAMNRAPDTYVKLTLMSPNGQEIARSKTSIRRGQPHPLFKETFMFQVALFQLPDVTLMVSVYNKRSMKRKEMIGWFSTGFNNSGDEESAHWNDMRESKGEQVCRWHVLLEA